MDYVSVDQAQSLPGLRLVLTQGVPGPWGEAAKALFRQRGVDYVPVAQIGGQENEALVAWTRHRNAPIALYNDESPRVRWLEMVELAERLGRGPSLIPEDPQERVLAVGLTNEVAGESGFAWHGRLLMLQAGYQAQGEAILQTPMYRDYFDVRQADAAAERVQQVLALLSAQIEQQRKNGSDYLVGQTLSFADIYWAYFSQLLDTYPPEKNPVPDFLRKSWGMVATAIGQFDPTLIAQRDYVFERHLELPMSF